jgi:hypothetical protein
MKKSLSLILFAILLAGPLMSQKQLYFGLSGTGLSSIVTNQNNYGVSPLDYKVVIGASGNVNVGFDFNKHFGLKLEIGYTKMGQKYEKSKKDTVFARNVKLNYLQIPLMFKYRTGGESARFYLQLGPQIDFLVSASQDYTLNDSVFVRTGKNLADQPFVFGEKTITERFSSLDVMGRLDLGVDISIVKNLCLNIGLTMAYGFLDINAPDWRMNDSDGNYNPSHNIYAGLNVGLNYVLPLGSKK